MLASASPRRVDLLHAAGFTFDVAPVDIDEARLPAERPDDYVQRVAWAKADAAAARRPGTVGLAADTAVIVGDHAPVPPEILGKPADAADAARMLRMLAGRAHEVLTGVAITDGRRRIGFVDVTRVWFEALSRDDIEAYVATGEPMGKAGAYAIQGRASRFVPRIEGAYANVVGLPVARVSEALRTFGIAR